MAGLFDTTYDFSSLSPVSYDAENQARAAANAAYQSAQASSKKTVAKPDTSDLDSQISLLKSAMKEASGFKRKELQQQLEIAQADREARIQAAQIAADASRYSADQGLAGTKYSSDNSLKGTMYSSDNSLKGTMYSADSSAAASRYNTDADIYKTNVDARNKRADQALSFLTQYENLASHPDSFLQASNYARLGYQVNGMPGMMTDLLGNVASNSATQGGNLAFRTGSGPMPQNAGVAIFGTNPLGLAQPYDGSDIAAPVWYGPQNGGVAYSGLMSPVFNATTSAYQPATGDAHRGALVSSYGVQADFLPQTARAHADEAATLDSQSGAIPGETTRPLLDANGVPRILTGQGLVSDQELSNEDQFKLGVRQLMQQGAHRLAPQALERMTQTERDMLASGIKDAGGVPQDFFDAYARSRIGNSGSGNQL